MKVEIDDIEDVMDQIVRIAPPTQKDDHKFLNMLRAAVEKNVVVNPGPGLQTLIEKSEQRDFRISSLALLRRDLPLQMRSAFETYLEHVKQQINAQEGAVGARDDAQPLSHHVEDHRRVRDEIARVREAIPGIQGKLRRAHEVVEDAFSKSSGRYLGPSGYAENFFRTIQ